MSARLSPAARLAGLIEATAVALFLFQALRVLFSVLFGLIYDALFAETASLAGAGLVIAVVLLALMAPLALPRRPRPALVAGLVVAVVVFLARLPLTFDEPRGRLVAAILIVAAAGLYVALLAGRRPRDLARALILGLVVDQLLRAAGLTFDPSLRPGWWPVQAGVSLLLCVLAGWRYRAAAAAERDHSRPRPRGFAARQAPGREPAEGTRLGLAGGLAWGAWLFLQGSLLAFPNAMARWAADGAVPGTRLLGLGYYPLLAAWLLFASLPLALDRAIARPAASRVGGALLLALLLAGLVTGYLLDGLAAFAGLALAQVASLLLLHNILAPVPAEEGSRAGWPFALGGVLFLLLGFAYAFTFTYAYTLDVFRVLGLPVWLAAGLLAGLPALRRPPVVPAAPAVARHRLRVWLAALGLGLLAVLLIVNAQLLASRPAADQVVRVATYNMHYGYDSDWHVQLEAQAQAIEAARADVVALQEVDAGRPTSYMIDDALWLGQRLGMRVVYLPALEHLSGIALLSRYPILDADTLLLPSDLEQTGIIWARLDLNGQPLNAFAIWLGLEPEERARQIDAALDFAAKHPGPAVWGGDFNSDPSSPVYQRIAAAGWTDPFSALGLGSPSTSPAVEPDHRIDFVWLRDLQPAGAEVSESLASDHRLVVVEVAWPGAPGE